MVISLLTSNLMSDLEELAKKINQFAIDGTGTTHSSKNLAASISIEASELMECFQWDDPTIDVEGGCSTTRECKIRISGCPQLHVEAVQHFGVESD